MKRTLTTLLLVFVCFLACNKQDHDLIIKAPNQSPETPIMYTATETVNEALQAILNRQNEELDSRIKFCSLAVSGLEREKAKEKKRDVIALPSTYPIYEK